LLVPPLWINEINPSILKVRQFLQTKKPEIAISGF